MTLIKGLQKGGKNAMNAWPQMKKQIMTTQINSLGTLSRQGELKYLPVPELEDTMAKWLLTTKPHLSKSEFDKTKALATSFVKEAEPLQKYLKDLASKTENWFSSYWLDIAYLGYRDPLTVWSNPGIVLPPQNFGNSEDKWLQYAAKLVHAAMDYKSRLDVGTIGVEMSGKAPMDMQQYYKLFGASRISGSPKDIQQFKPKSTYAVVIHNGNFFKLPLFDANQNNSPASQIFSSLKHIVEDSKRLQVKGQIGILTSDTRDDAFRTYNMLKDSGNSESLDVIESSLFVLCLDDDIKSDQDIWTRSAINSLHGYGSQTNGFNRWFGKAIQMIVAKSGEVSISNEHSFCEAVPVIAMADDMLDKMKDNHNIVQSQSPMLDDIAHVSFKLDSRIEEEIKRAAKSLDALNEDLSMKVLNFDDFGKEFIKSQRMSPDSFVQMAIQLAFYKMHKVPAATYESGGTRTFLHGRTEVIRSCSIEATEFSRLMVDKDVSLKVKQDALKNAIATHNSYAKAAVGGLGVDRHLQGLKMAAVNLGVDIPELYNDPGYTRSSRMRLSTSQISSKHGGFACYGPLQMDGYGCCYSIGQNLLSFAVSAMNSNAETNAIDFASTLHESLEDLHDLCVAKSKL